jgi:hypothetical protein
MNRKNILAIAAVAMLAVACDYQKQYYQSKKTYAQEMSMCTAFTQTVPHVKQKISTQLSQKTK